MPQSFFHILSHFPCAKLFSCMALLLSCFGVAVLGMIGLLLFYPKLTFRHFSLDTFWIPPLLGAIVILATKSLDISRFWQGLTAPTAMNPLEILVLFFSMTFLSAMLDASGFFEWLANRAAKRAKGNQFLLFFLFALLAGILTIFTSNDIVIITLTPFLIAFCKKTNIDPVPYLVAEFVAANTYSMLLIIGNPTNIYLSSAENIDFLAYLKVMALPTLFAGITSFALLLLLFFKKLKMPFMIVTDEVKIKDRFLFVASFVLLSSCIILMALSSYLGLPMWIISLGAAGLLLVLLISYDFIAKKSMRPLLEGAKRLPYSLVPFLLSMFAFVMAFDQNGLTINIAQWLSSFSSPLLSYGISSFLSANFMNNIPMSVLFSTLLVEGNAGQEAIYSTIISSNLAAILSPVGALAGMMWMSILKEKKVSFSFLRFMGYGAIISIPTVTMSFLALYLVL